MTHRSSSLTRALACHLAVGFGISCTSFFGSTAIADAHEFGTKTWDFTYDSGRGADVGVTLRLDSQGRIAVGGWVPTTGDLSDALVFQITPGESDVNWDVERNVSAVSGIASTAWRSIPWTTSSAPG